jgi:hypothetical protein
MLYLRQRACIIYALEEASQIFVYRYAPVGQNSDRILSERSLCAFIQVSAVY